jgi:hypothetical protein
MLATIALFTSGSRARRVRRVAVRLVVVLGMVAIAWAAASPASAQLQLNRLIVSVTAPSPGATVSGTTTISASVEIVGLLTVVGVQFMVDGVNVGAEDTTRPYSIPWNTRTTGNGPHTVTAVARDLLGARWWSDPVSVTVFNDLTPPTVSVTAPAAGTVVSGTTTVRASAADDVGVAGVQFRLDGASFGAEDTAAPYEIPWNSAAASSGLHTWTAVARDAAGNTTTSAGVSVTVDNAPPSVGITAPSAGATVSGAVTVKATASDNVGVAGVQFRLDGANLGAEDTTAPYEVAWNTVSASGGPHTLTAVARDVGGQTTTSAAVTVTSDNAAPSVSITAPAAGSTVSGIVAFSASASDNLGVAGVQFFIDGAAHGAEDTSAPYSTAWDTGTAAAGSHTLTARARDGAGNSTMSAAVTVTVETVDTTAPSVSITAPAAGSTVSGIVAVDASASDNVGVAGVQFFIDGAAHGVEDTSAPYSTMWDSTTASAGSHTLTARARDAAGNSTTSAAVAVTVSGGGGGTTLRLEDGDSSIAYSGGWNLGNTAKAWSGGTAAVGFAEGQTATVDFRGTGVRWVSFQAPYAGIARVYIDGTLAGTVDLYAPQETVLPTVFTASGLPLGPHTLRIEVTRTKNPASGDFLIVIDAIDILDPVPDTQAPTITITDPTGGEIVFGTLPVVASASDDVGVSGVTFFVDGAPLGSMDSLSPYTVNWTTTSVPDGAHTLTAVARDAAGNTTTSAPVTVTVSNAAPPATATATRVENTDLAITYVDGCVSCGQVPTWFHGSRSRTWSAGTASFNRSDGGRASLTFTGSAVRWIGFRASWAGIARVFIDGAFVAEIDLYAPTEEVRVPVFEIADLAAGTHTIAVEATGRKNPDAADYAVVVDAFDVSPAAPPNVDGTRVEQTAASTTFTAGWTQGDATRAWSGGTAAVSDTVGARATFVFTGTAVDWVAARSPEMGLARVYLDGAFHAEVDLYAARSYQGVVFTATSLAVGQHRLEVEVTGGRNANATGHAVAVDAFDIRSRLEDNDGAMTYSGTWLFNDTDRNWSGTSLTAGTGTAARTETAGASVQFTFRGTSVSWIGIRGPWAGMADVYLDGAFAERVDLYAPAEQVQARVLTRSDLAAGPLAPPHTLRIDVTGEKNPASSMARVVIDAFNVTPPMPAAQVTRVQDSHSSVAYSPGWVSGGRSTLWSGEDARHASTVGAQATVTFTGTSIRWVGERGFGTGVARVLLDGQLVAQVDTRSPFQEEYQTPLLTLTGLSSGTHTLTIEVIGRNGEAAGAAVQPVIVDAFDIQ